MSDPCGNRTRPSSLRGWCPQPIDERAKVGCEGIEPLVIHSACLGTTVLQTAAESTTQSVAQAGVEPADTRRFELRRSAGWRTVPQASSTGFEPVISCVTGRRALQA